MVWINIYFFYSITRSNLLILQWNSIGQLFNGGIHANVLLDSTQFASQNMRWIQQGAPPLLSNTIASPTAISFPQSERLLDANYRMHRCRTMLLPSPWHWNQENQGPIASLEGLYFFLFVASQNERINNLA